MFVDGCVFYFAVESVQGRLGEICEREMTCPFCLLPFLRYRVGMPRTWSLISRFSMCMGLGFVNCRRLTGAG